MAYIKDLSNKTALITGGSSGIGLAIARLLSEEGAKVIILGRDKGRLRSAKRSLGSGSMALSADVGDPRSLDRAVKELKEDGISLDILVNSAGLVHPVPLLEQTQEEVEETMRTNLLGTINSCRAFVPLMGSPGFIVNISSFAGLLGLYGYSSYSASKFGIVGLSESLYLELRGRGIRVGIVYPTDTDTPQLRNELKRRPEELSRMTGLGGTIGADKVARSVVRGIRKGSFHIFPTFMPWFIHKVHGPFGPLVRFYLRRKLVGR